MLQTSRCPFSIGVCAGCWVDDPPVGGGRGAPANIVHRNLSTKQEPPSSCWDTCYFNHLAHSPKLVCISSNKTVLIVKESIDYGAA